MKFSLLCATVCASLLSAALFAEAPKFKEGDRVCFIGDSITHGGLYHMDVVLFYATRFPQEKIEFWNCGISGDSAVGGVRRYAWDIAPHKPTVSTIMMGMNDVGRHLYAEGKTGKDVETQRQKAIDSCNANVDKLAGMLAKDGSSVIFITPSIFDQTGTQKIDKMTGVNDALRACGEAGRKLAEKYKGGLVDFNAPMTKLNAEVQAKDPNFTLVGGDRVHPGAFGHLVMAYLFLKEQGMSPVVSTMDIDAAKASVAKQDNCSISKLAAKDGGVSFDSLEKALPFPVDDAAKKAFELVPFTDGLNQELLKVSGLKEGNYEVIIDGAPVLKTTAAELAKGVNLALVKETPQYKQAQNVLKLVKERYGLEGKLRTLAQVDHWFFANAKERTPESDKKLLDERLAEFKTKKMNYHASVIEGYFKYLPEREAIQKSFDESLAKIYEASQPKAHSYGIRPVK